MNKILTDASPWVAYFSGKECLPLELGLAAGVLAVPPLVALELMANPLPSRERKAFESLVGGLVANDMPKDHWENAARLKLRLEQNGISFSARDAHIFQLTLDLDAVLLTDDPLFLRAQKTAGVRVQIW